MMYNREVLSFINAQFSFRLAVTLENNASFKFTF